MLKFFLDHNNAHGDAETKNKLAHIHDVYNI